MLLNVSRSFLIVSQRRRRKNGAAGAKFWRFSRLLPRGDRIASPVLRFCSKLMNLPSSYTFVPHSSHRSTSHTPWPRRAATCVPHTRMSQLRPELALSTLTPDAAIDIVKWMPCAVNLLPEFRSAAVEEFRRGNKDQRLVGIRHGPGASEIRGLALYRFALPRSFACPLLAF